MATDPAFGEDERNEKRRENGNEVGRDHERKEGEKVLLVALVGKIKDVLALQY